MFRDSCTDLTWKSPLCLQLCTVGNGYASMATGSGGELVDDSQTNVQVTDCNDGSCCCGSGKYNVL